MKATVLLLLLLLPEARSDDYEEEPVKVSCEDRCLRIHERSLDRIGFSKSGADRYIDKTKPDETMLRDVCWKQYDYFYCMKGCAKSAEHEKHVRHVKSRCKTAVEDLESGLSCLFKYRSFLEIRCSSFMNEAIRLKQADDPDLLPDKETCRYLHLNALCLENSVGAFCPQATPFFRRLNLRDFFLNHILPADDELFDDQDLDACQLKDFVKEALEGVKLSPQRHEETTTSSTSTTTSSDDADDESEEEEAWPATTAPPSVVRTLSPSTRDQSALHTSTTSNFVYTTPTRKHSTLVGTSPTPIHISREQALKTTTARGEGRGQRITVTPKTHSTTTSARPTTRDPSTTTTRRRLFDSDEDFTQTPPNFLWGSFRGEHYKLARNYSESFPHNEQFVTPVTIESSTLFGDDDDSRDDDDNYGSPQVIDIDRDLPVTVTGRPVKLSTIITLVDEKKKTIKRIDEDTSSAVYEHAVDTQLQATTDVLHSRVLPIDSGEQQPKTVAKVHTVTGSSNEWTTVGKILPTDADIYDDDGVPSDPNDIVQKEKEKDKNRLHPEHTTHGFLVVQAGEDSKEEAEKNFDRALLLDKEEDDDANEIRTDVIDEGKLDVQAALTTTRAPDTFTPLINGGRVAVKSIKQFRLGEEESAQDWAEDPSIDDSHVQINDFDDYDKETYIATEVLEDEARPRDADVRRRINFILAYTSLFFVLLLLVICCILVVIIKNRRNASIDQRYKMHSDL